MSITIEIDEAVLQKAELVTRIHDRSELIRRALETFSFRREAQGKLAALGGTMSDLELPPRQRDGAPRN